jgi:glucokinase
LNLSKTADPAEGNKVLVGLDIGGTKIAALIVDKQFNPLAQLERPTDASGHAGVVKSVTATLDEALEQAKRTRNDILAIGIAIPGLCDPSTGVVRLAVNLNLVSYALGPAISELYDAPSYLENDVRAGALGAYRFANQLQPVRNLAYLSIGTGISSGVILDGRLHRGANGMAGEIGHVIMEPGGARCGCGMPGCLEAVAAGPAVARLGEMWMKDSADGRPLTTRDIYAAAGQGDEAAQRVVAHVSGHYARAIQLLIMAYDVDKVVLGGGVSRAGQTFLSPILEALAGMRAESNLARAMLPDEKVLLLPADYSAGGWGAIILAQQALAQRSPGEPAGSPKQREQESK